MTSGAPKVISGVPNLISGVPKIILRHAESLRRLVHQSCGRDAENRFRCTKVVAGVPKIVAGVPETVSGQPAGPGKPRLREGICFSRARLY